jgi:glycosyltransferase involved in cell wall biosynthesis
MVGGRFRLTIAGDGPDREKLESLAEYLGVSDRIAFLGHITNQELRVLMSAVDATVFLPHSLHREGLPMVVLESLALNVPVVTLDGPLWPDDVRDELQFVDPEAPDSLRQLLDSAILLAKPTLPSRFTEEAVVTEWSKLLLGVKER